MSDRRLSRMIDEYVTGVHDPNAPFNREVPPCCEDCEVEDCKEPCQTLKKLIEERDAEIRKQDDMMFKEWKKDNPDFKEETKK